MGVGPPPSPPMLGNPVRGGGVLWGVFFLAFCPKMPMDRGIKQTKIFQISARIVKIQSIFLKKLHFYSIEFHEPGQFFMKDICVGLRKKTVPAYKAPYNKNVIFLEISIVFSEKK